MICQGNLIVDVPYHPELLVTADYPDLVAYLPDTNRMSMTEVTVPFKSNIEKDDQFKINK